MTPSPFAPDRLPTTAAAVLAFAPTAAALWARRSLREPAGQIAVNWLLMALLGSVGFVRAYFLPTIPKPPTHTLVLGLLPLLLLPPTLTWAGRSAKRWQWPLMAAWAVCAVVLVAVLPDQRELATIGDPIMTALMAATTTAALASQVGNAPSAVGRRDWLWILTGHLLYFVAGMFRMPLMEVFVGQNGIATRAVNDGVMVLYSGAYLVIARGMLLRTADVPTSGYMPPTVRTA